ncbi:MAG: futalosine hydrolase [Bacteroidota bacterium]
MSDKAKKYFSIKAYFCIKASFMHFLLAAATAFEIRPLLDRMPLLGKQSEQFSRYQYKNSLIDVLITGVGMVPTAYFLGKHLAMNRYDLVINAGIAGTFNKSLPPGSVVNVVEDCVPELGAEDGDRFLSVFELGLTDPDSPPYKNGKLFNDIFEKDSLVNLEIIRKLPKVRGITSSTVRGNAESIARIKKLAMADLESMEGAAFFFSCLTEKIPCLQLRAISNLVEQRDKSRWKLSLALKNLNKVLWDTLALQ